MILAPPDQYKSPPSESAISERIRIRSGVPEMFHAHPSRGPMLFVLNIRTEVGPPSWKRSENKVGLEIPNKRPVRAAREKD